MVAQGSALLALLQAAQGGGVGSQARPRRRRGSVHWGGQAFNDPASLVAWINARRHGGPLSVTDFLASHPGAASIFASGGTNAPGTYGLGGQDRQLEPAGVGLAQLKAQGISGEIGPRGLGGAPFGPPFGRHRARRVRSPLQGLFNPLNSSRSPIRRRPGGHTIY